MSRRPSDDELISELYEFLRSQREDRQRQERVRRIEADRLHDECYAAARAAHEEKLREMDEHSWLDDIDWNEIAAGAGYTIGGPLLQEFIEKKRTERSTIGGWIRKLF